MRTPEQALKTYYASMTDSDLVTVAKNRNSFIRLAHALLDQELNRRKLTVPAVVGPEAGDALPLLARLWDIIRRKPPKYPGVTRKSLVARPRMDPEHSGMRHHAGGGHRGATEDQVSMVGTLPERVNAKGTKIEEIAGTGGHDSLGG